MTRAGFLFVICVALIGIYLFVRYQKTGEVFQIGWRKPAAKTNSNPNIIRPVEIRFVDAEEMLAETPETDVEIATPPSTNRVKNQDGENSLPSVSLMRSDDPRRQRVQVPTNAVWGPARNRPGVRIAFP